MSEAYEAASEVAGPLRDIDTDLENIRKSIDAAAAGALLPRREALGRAIYLQMIASIISMRGIPSAPLRDGRKELAVAAWDLADELLSAELLGVRTGALVPGEDDEAIFEPVDDGGINLGLAENDVDDLEEESSNANLG